MKLILAKTSLDTIAGPKLMRLAGFIYIVDRLSGKGSYSRPLGRYHYPRFHSYIEESQSGLVINLHLDQKQASYEGSKRHSGEYDGEAVEGEMARIKAVALASGYEDRGQRIIKKETDYAATSQTARPVANVNVLGSGDFRRVGQVEAKKSWWQKLFG